MKTLIENKNRGALAEKIHGKVNRYSLFDPQLRIFKHTHLPRRLEMCAEINGVKYINDAAATGVNATYYSLNKLRGEVIWIVCNDEADAAFEELGPVMVYKTRHIIACGRSAEVLEKLYGSRIPVSRVHHPEEAVAWASRIAVPGTYVLFSPAAKSNRYETERLSNRFTQAIKKLKNK